jgi:RimJ/RimL family protein N-acetyltransferase
MFQVSAILKSENLILCAPNLNDFKPWAEWFNDSSITRFLSTKNVSITEESQKLYYLESLSNNKLIFMIKERKKRTLLGTISLKIEEDKKIGEIALVVPIKVESAPLAALEAIATLTQFGFEKINLNKIKAGQVYPGLQKWTGKMLVLGYSIYGYEIGGDGNDLSSEDVVLIYINKKHFLDIKKLRGNSFWGGTQYMSKLLEDNLEQKIEECASVIRQIIKLGE